MNFLTLGFFTGLSLILALGAQNVFVIEQGLKKQYVFLVCLICSVSDFILIFLGIFLFQYFGNFFNTTIEFILNILLFLFLIYFIYGKISVRNKKIILNQGLRLVYGIVGCKCGCLYQVTDAASQLNKLDGF